MPVRLTYTRTPNLKAGDAHGQETCASFRASFYISLCVDEQSPSNMTTSNLRAI